MVGKRSAQAGGEVDLRDPGWHEKTCPQQVGKCAYRKIFAKEMLKSDESKIMCQHTIWDSMCHYIKQTIISRPRVNEDEGDLRGGHLRWFGGLKWGEAKLCLLRGLVDDHRWCRRCSSQLCATCGHFKVARTQFLQKYALPNVKRQAFPNFQYQDSNADTVWDAWISDLTTSVEKVLCSLKQVRWSFPFSSSPSSSPLFSS